MSQITSNRKSRKTVPGSAGTRRRGETALGRSAAFERFKEDLMRELGTRVPGDLNISVREYTKSNDCRLNGISFMPDPELVDTDITGIDDLISPIFYIDDLYSAYIDGELRISEIADHISRQYYANVRPPFEIQKLLGDYEQAKHSLAFKLLNTERNRDLLVDVPHREILDLSIVPFCKVGEDAGGIILFTVTRDIMEEWGQDADTLIDDAMSSAPALLPYSLNPLSRLLDEAMPDRVTPFPAGPELYVLTNCSRAGGAAALLYTGLMEDIGKSFGGDFFVLPSSVHEVLLLRDEGYDPEALSDIVRDVNETEVRPEEFLSDHVYRYDCEAGVLESL